MQAIIETWKAGGEAGWSDIEEQVVDIAKKYPDTVDLHSVDEDVDLAEDDNTMVLNGAPGSPSAQGKYPFKLRS